MAQFEHPEEVELLLQAEPQPLPQEEHDEEVELLLQAEPQPLPQEVHVLPIKAFLSISSSLVQDNSEPPKATPTKIGSDLFVILLKNFLLEMKSLLFIFLY